MANELVDIENKRTSGAHVSFWTESNPDIRMQPLSRSVETEIVIIGGGIAGVSVAYTLCKLGKKVILIEDGFIGSGESGRTTAHLVTSLDDRYYKLEKIYGVEKTALIADSHKAAINYIEKTILEEHIECDFRRVDGYLFLHPSDKLESLDKELAAAGRAGVRVERVHHVPGMIHRNREALRFSDQAEFHIMKYLNGLCNAILRMGGEIYTETHAEKIEKNSVTTSQGYVIKAKHIVDATNASITSLYSLPLKQFPYRTYVIGGIIKKDSLPKCLWWDTGNINKNSDISAYHYARTAKYNDECDLLIIGGEDHPTGMSVANGESEEHRYEKLEIWIREHFRMDEIVYRWSGQIMETMDCMAYIGRSPGKQKNLYVITGDSGNGMTHSAIAGLLISDIIMGKKNPWEGLYDPARFKLFESGQAFLKENIKMLLRYFKTNPKNMDAAQLKKLQKGQGIIVKQNSEKYAVYRDDENKLHWVSAKCTHLKCLVRWNKDEKSWDCPCHGSRFNFKGEVLNGPANKALDYHKDTFPEFTD